MGRDHCTAAAQLKYFKLDVADATRPSLETLEALAPRLLEA